MKKNIPVKLFIIIILIVSFFTFLTMNFNLVSVTFIFTTIRIPLTIIFFVFFIIGGLTTSYYWKKRYNELKLKNIRLEKLLFKKEQIERTYIEKTEEL